MNNRADGIMATTESYSGTAKPPNPPPGQIGRWQITRFLARGGLGEVLIAHDEELRRTVAVKTIRPDRTASPELRRRFEREAEITGRLQHPGVVPVYGYHREGTAPAYAMRLIEGESLADAIQRAHSLPTQERALEVRRLLAAFVQVCHAVAYAHAQGIIHRDIKPANIMLGRFGEVLLVDWGLARELSETSRLEGDRIAETAETTGYGQIIGTPAYMSPEQARGDSRKVGPLSDVFSLGATLFTILTARLPLLHPEPFEHILSLSSGATIRPRSVDRQVAANWDAICAKAMAFVPKGRYSTATELATDVERALADEPIAAYREPLAAHVRRWARRHRSLVYGLVAITVTLILSLSVAVILLERAYERTEIQRLRAEQETERALLGEKQIRKHEALARQAIADFAAVGRSPALEHHPARAKLLEIAERYFRECCAEVREDPDSWRARAGALNEWAGVLFAAGRHSESCEKYTESRELLRQLIRDFPSDRSLAVSYAQTTANHAAVLVTLGKHREALELIEVCRGSLGTVSLNDPTHGRRFRAELEINSAISYLTLGRIAEAETAFRNVQDLYPADASQNLSPHERYQLGVAYRHHGELLSKQGDLLRGEERLRRALAQFRQLEDAGESAPALEVSIALTAATLADCLDDRGQPQEAASLRREARTRLDELAAAHPKIDRYQGDLAGVLLNEGVALYRTGKPTSAEEALLAADQILRGLLEREPQSKQYRFVQAKVSSTRARIALDRGATQEALEQLNLASRYRSELVHEEPENIEYREDAAAGAMIAAMIHRDRGDWKSALRLAGDAVDHRRRIVAQMPTSVAARNRLAKAYGFLGSLHLRHETYPEAQIAFAAGVNELKPLLNSHPGDRSVLRDFVHLAIDQAGVALHRRRFQESAAAVDPAWQVLRAASSENRPIPLSPPTYLKLLTIRAETHRGLGHHLRAVSIYRKGLKEIPKAAVDSGSRNPGAIGSWDRFLRGAAMMETKVGNSAGAARLLEDLAARVPSERKLLLLEAARLHLQSGSIAGALAAWHRLRSDRTAAEATSEREILRILFDCHSLLWRTCPLATAQAAAAFFGSLYPTDRTHRDRFRETR